MKVAELSGAQLDWAVARAEGLDVRLLNGGTEMVLRDGDWWYPSESWAQGGPIIEQEGISLYLDTNNLWQANIFDDNPAVFFGSGVEGSTPLIAAMRCYVAHKLGEEIEVPEELMEV